MNALRSFGRIVVISVLAGVFASAIMLGVQKVRAFGTPPAGNAGFALVDNQWLVGLANGLNFSYQNGLTAAGTNQATALQLGSGIVLFEVDTAAASTGVALPECVAPAKTHLRNAGAQTLSVYSSPTLNTAVSPAAADTINGTAGSTAYTMATNTNAIFFCAKNGNWSAIKGS